MFTIEFCVVAVAEVVTLAVVIAVVLAGKFGSCLAKEATASWSIVDVDAERGVLGVDGLT